MRTRLRYTLIPTGSKTMSIDKALAGETRNHILRELQQHITSCVRCGHALKAKEFIYCTACIQALVREEGKDQG